MCVLRTGNSMNELYKVLNNAPDDARLYVNRHTNTVFPITHFHSLEQVEKRREELRFNLRMAAGLYPWPDKTPLNVKTEDVGVYDGYSLKRIMFESYPGLWSTGNLYLPDPMPEKAPAILNVIGHWENQRLTREDTADYPAQLANFAKMGFVCLVTDMIGKVDSRQLSHNYGREEKELWTSNGLGVQLWNNIRALDLLCEMPGVDRENIGVTGASGGGSQTLFLSLVDDRIKAAAPINMISLHMQGGCQCENAAGLRRDTDNTEMCAMIAPRALFLAGSDGDWTKNLETDEMPAVLEAYRQYGAEHMAEHFYQIAPHQYNAKTRHHVYNFFARHLMGKNIEWNELPIETDDLLDFTWFRGNGRAPGFADDDAFFTFHKAERTEKTGMLCEEEKRKMLGWITGIRETEYRIEPVSSEKQEKFTLEKSVLRSAEGAVLPLIKLIPDGWNGKRICLALGADGKECLDRADLYAMLDNGVALITGDLFLTGESADCSMDIQGTPGDNAYYTTFNYTADALRVQDASLLIRAAAETAEEAILWAEGCGARSAVCALALTDCVQSAVLEKAALELDTDEAYMQNFRIPGIRTIGGLEACAELIKCDVKYF